MNYYRFPISCEWNITNRCNLNCIFCSMDSKMNVQHEIFTDIFTIKKTVKKIKESGAIYVSLSGGEPFCHPFIYEIIEELRINNLIVTLTTNGTLINENVLQKLENLDVKWIQLSLHSDMPKENDFLMGGNAFERILHTIQLIEKSKIGLSVCGVKYGINNTAISRLSDSFNSKNIVFYEKKLINVGRASTNKIEKTTCQISERGGTFYSIMPNGDIKVCGESKIVLGNISTDDVLQIWEKYQRVFSSCREKGICIASITNIEELL